MKVLRIIGSTFFTLMLMGIIVGYTYSRIIEKTIVKKEFVIENASNSSFTKDVKKSIDKTIDKLLDNIEKNIEKQIKENSEDYGIKKKDVDKYLKSSEGKKLVKDTKEEISNALQNFNSEENINEIIVTFINMIYDEKEISISSGIMKDKIDEIVNRTIEEKNIKLSKESKKELDSFINELSTTLNKNLIKLFDGSTLVNEEKDTLTNPLPALLELFKSANAILLTIIITLIIFILLINIKKLFAGFNFVAFALLTSGLIIKAGNIVLSIISPSSLLKTKDFGLNDILQNILNKIIEGANKTSLILIISSVVIFIVNIIVKLILKNRKQYENEETLETQENLETIEE